MKKGRLAVIVLNWNGADDTIKCVSSLINQSRQTDIVIVDNASSDNSVEKIKTLVDKNPRENIHLIQNDINSGYTGGNNVGFKYALDQDYEYIGTLNPDAVADKDWCKSLCDELANRKDTGIATGILARSDKKTLDSTGDFYTSWGIPSPRGRDQPIKTAPDTPGYVFGSTGGGFIARAQLLQDVGLFDEKFFMYFEDVDFSFRAQLAGYKVRYTPKAIAYHKISSSTNKVPGLAIKQTFKNLPILFLKNVPARLWWKIALKFFLAYHLILGHAILRGRGVPAMKGWFGGLILIPYALKSRYVIQKKRRVSDEYINSIILHDIPPEQIGLRKFRRVFIGKS